MLLPALLAMYTAAAHSVLGMFGMAAGTLAFAALRVRRKEILPFALTGLVFAVLAGYNVMARDSHAFRNKFGFLFAPDDPWVEVTEFGGMRRRVLGGWSIVGHPSRDRAYLLRMAPTKRAPRATLVVEGELRQGEIGFYVENGADRSEVLQRSISRPGKFRVELQVDPGRGDGWTLIAQEKPSRGTISSLRWQFGSQPAAPAAAQTDDGKLKNLQERFGDWHLYRAGIVESPKTLLFGHSMPLPREVRTSAHNFYIDLAYNFGILALAPIAALLAYTIWLLWRRRELLRTSEPTLVLAAVVLFLVLIESNLKVSLRQPYPGIAIYFLWGVLLSRLRAPAKA